MNKVRNIFLSLFLVLTLVSCGGKKGQNSTANINVSIGYQMIASDMTLEIWGIHNGTDKKLIGDFGVDTNIADPYSSHEHLYQTLEVDIPNGHWDFYTIEWSGRHKRYSGLVLCGMAFDVTLDGSQNIVDVYIHVAPSHCGHHFFGQLDGFDNFCYQPGESTGGIFRAGTGSTVDPYVVCNKQHMEEIGINYPLYTDSHFILRKDINYHEGLTFFDFGLPFTMIGDELIGNHEWSTRFQGTFDGNNHAIIGLRIDPGQPDDGSSGPSGTGRGAQIGFIRNLGHQGVVKDLIFFDPFINDQNSKSYNKVGVVAGEATGTIQNVKVLHGDVQGGEHVGGLVGYGTSYSSGHALKIENSGVKECDVEGNRDVGGLVGYFKNNNYTAGGPIIYQSWATGEVEADTHSSPGCVIATGGSAVDDQDACEATISAGTDAYWDETLHLCMGHCEPSGCGCSVESGFTANEYYPKNIGGIVGKAEIVSSGADTIIIQESVSTNDVSGELYIGGLAGTLYGSTGETKIYDSYSISNLTSFAGGGNVYMGGLVGKISGSSQMMRNFHSIGGFNLKIGIDPPESYNVHGLVGLGSCDALNFSSSSIAPGCGTQKTYNQIRTATAYSTWGNVLTTPGETWIMRDNWYDTPQLSWEPERPCHGLYGNAPFASGSTPPLLICTKAHFANMINYPGHTYVLLNHIDLTGETSFITFANTFSGNLLGAYHTISNIKKPLFNEVAAGSLITNIAIHGADLGGMGGSTYSNLGALARQNYGILDRIDAYGRIIGSSNSTPDTNFGSIVAINRPGGKITRAYSNINISGNDNIGGIAGINQGEIIYSLTHSNIQNDNTNPYTFNNVGGLVGINMSSGTIKESEAHGYIQIGPELSSQIQNFGGLVGWNQFGIIDNSLAMSSIHDSSLGCSIVPCAVNVGGFVGLNESYGLNIYHSFTNSYLHHSSSSIHQNWGVLIGKQKDNAGNPITDLSGYGYVYGNVSTGNLPGEGCYIDEIETSPGVFDSVDYTMCTSIDGSQDIDTNWIYAVSASLDKCFVDKIEFTETSCLNSGPEITPLVSGVLSVIMKWNNVNDNNFERQAGNLNLPYDEAKWITPYHSLGWSIHPDDYDDDFYHHTEPNTIWKIRDGMHHPELRRVHNDWLYKDDEFDEEYDSFLEDRD